MRSSTVNYLVRAVTLILSVLVAAMLTSPTSLAFAHQPTHDAFELTGDRATDVASQDSSTVSANPSWQLELDVFPEKTTQVQSEMHPSSSQGLTLNAIASASDLQPSELQVEAWVSPSELVVGQEATITIQIQNTGKTSIHGIRFRNDLPDGLEFASISPSTQRGSEPPVEPEANNPDLVATIGTLNSGESVTLTYQVKAKEISNAASAITDVLQVSAARLNSPALAELTFIVANPEHNADVVYASGFNTITTPGVTLRFPRGASPDRGAVVIKPKPHGENSTGPQSQWDLVFLTDPGLRRPNLGEAAQQALSKGRKNSTDSERSDVALSKVLDETRPLTEVPIQFAEPVEMEVSFDNLASLADLPADQAPFVVVWDENAKLWVHQPLEAVNSSEGSVTVQTTHFSTWGAGVAGSFPTNGASILLYDEARVATFTGRGTYSYPLWTPAGRNGMTPSVALAYSSGTVDGILGDVQSPWTGMGWNIDSIEVSRKIMTGGCGSGCGSGAYGYKNEFVLAFNGSAYKLIADATIPGRYHTEDHSFLYIQRHNVQLANAQDGGVNPPNDADEWWEVVTAEGTRYRLGWNANSEQLAAMKGYTPGLGGAWMNLGYAGAVNDRVAQRWRVDLVKDVYGNTLSYDYAEETRVVAGTSLNYDRASYLATIRYTGTNGAACNPTSESCYEVRFVRANRAAGYDLPSTNLAAWDTWDGDYLDEVRIYALTGSQETLLRTYNLGFEEVERQDSDGDTQTWDSLVLKEIVTTGGSTTAPKIRFNYTNFDNRAQTLGAPEWAYPRLTAIHNGTEGTVTFTYGDDGRPANQYFAWRILWRQATDGVTSEVMRTDYTYGPACYDNAADPTNGWCNAGKTGQLVGHEWAIETVKNFNGAVLSSSKHYFYTDKAKSGREYRTESRNPSETIFFKSETDFTSVDSTMNSSYPTGVRFIYASETRQYERQGTSLNLVTRQTFTYDTNTGSLLNQKQFDRTGALFRETATTYINSQSQTYLDTSFEGTYTFCANENGTCTFTGTTTIRYGANGSYAYRTATGSIACNNATFGDPIPGVGKSCHYHSGSSGFTYLDDSFRSTNQPNYARGEYLTSGGYSGGAAQVIVGQVDNNAITNGMSGGWRKSWTLTEATPVTISFRYHMTVPGTYESDEWGQVLVSVDGVLYGTSPNDYVVQRAGGNGNQVTGWQTFTVNVGTLSAGSHTITLGGYNNKKTASDEFTTILIDDVKVIKTTANAYLHSFPRSVITKDGQDNVLSETYYAYDGTTAGLGAKGELTLQQTKTRLDLTSYPNQTLDTSYSYDATGNLTSTRVYGQYGTLGGLPISNDVVDKVASVTYDSIYHSYPKTTTSPDPDGTGPLNAHTVITEYDFERTGELPLGLPRTTTDPNGGISTIVYDGLGRPIEVWQPGATQASIKTIYPALVNDEIAAPYTMELQIWDSGGPGGPQFRSAWAFYDGWGRIIRTIGPAEDATKYIQTDNWYNAIGGVERSARPYEVTMTVPPGAYSAPNWLSTKSTITEVDAFGRVTRVTAPDGTRVQTLYDGRTTSVIDPNGHKRENIVDDFGRLITVREYTGDGTQSYAVYSTMTYEYDTRSLLKKVVDNAGNQTFINYDALGRKTSMDDPDMGTWSYTYDLWGQMDVQTDARGAQIHFTYDKLGRVLTRQARMISTDPWVTVASFSYDSEADGNKGIGRQTGASSVYVGGNPTVIDAVTYDELGRPTSTTRTIDGTAYTTQATYDSIGRVLTMTLPTGEVVTTGYNARGLAESLTGTSTYVSSTDYTATGATDRQVLGNGVITDFSYYTESNRLERIYTAKAGTLPLVDLTYQYDSAGNITQMEDGVHEETRYFSYDHLDRLVSASVFDDTQMLEERYYSYDTLGNMLSFRLWYPSVHSGRGVTLPGGSASSTNFQSRVSFNGISGAGQTSTTYSGSAFSPYVYGFGATGTSGQYQTRGSFASGAQVSSENYSGAAGINPASGDTSSEAFRLTGLLPFVRGLIGGFGGWEQPEPYDGPTGEGEFLTYTYGAGNAGPHAVTSLSDGSVFTYDANGNMITRAKGSVTWTHIFDAENRLVSVSNGTSTTTYTYDANGSRIKRTVTLGGSTTTTIYVAGMEIEKTNGTETKRTIYYGMGGAFLVITSTATALYFRHGDHLGSTSVLSNASGQAVIGTDVVFAPFGEIRSGQQSTLTDFAYTGQRLDSSTDGLMYYGARYYLPELRRFISPDTIVPGAANPQAFNRYSYVLNNPINSIDPSGHISCNPAVCGSGGIGSGNAGSCNPAVCGRYGPVVKGAGVTTGSVRADSKTTTQTISPTITPTTMPTLTETYIPTQVPDPVPTATAYQVSLSTFGVSEGTLFGWNTKRGPFFYLTGELPFNKKAPIEHNVAGSTLATTMSIAAPALFKGFGVPFGGSAGLLVMTGSDDSRDFKGTTEGRRTTVAVGTHTITTSEDGNLTYDFYGVNSPDLCPNCPVTDFTVSIGDLWRDWIGRMHCNIHDGSGSGTGYDPVTGSC